MAPYLKVPIQTQYEFMNNKTQKSSTSALKDVSKDGKNFTDQKFRENGKKSEGISTEKAEITQLNDLNLNELQDSLKHQAAFARNWIKKNVVPSGDATLSFCVLLITYYQFCKENEQLPLKAEELLQVLRSSFECDDSLCSDDQSSKTDENNQEYLSSLVELKLEDAARGDDLPKDYSSDLKNMKFKCSFVKTESSESDEAYESDLSDSDMKEVSIVPECINYEDRDSSYESYDEISNEAISLRVKSEDKDFKKQLEVTNISGISLANRPNGLNSTQGTAISDIKKVINQSTENFVRVKRQIENDDRHNSLLPPPKKLKWTEDQKKVIVNMKELLDSHLQNYKSSECYIQAKNLSDTVVGMLQRKQLRYFLEEFGHAMSCGEKHGSLCFMFKRVVNHVLRATHDCALKNMYGHILRLHLDACNEDHCGFPNCKVRREERRERLMNQLGRNNLSQSESN